MHRKRILDSDLANVYFVANHDMNECVNDSELLNPCLFSTDESILTS